MISYFAISQLCLNLFLQFSLELQEEHINQLYQSANQQQIMLAKICPCFNWFYQKFRNELAKKAGYSPGNQFEEEQFTHNPEPVKSQQTNSNQLISQQITIEQQIQNALLSYQLQTKTSQPHPTDHEFQQIDQPTAIEKDKTPSQITKSVGFRDLGELQINIPENGPYYQLLKQKTSNVAELFQISAKCTEISFASQTLQNENKSQLRVWKKSDNNCFFFEFEIPCSYAYYNQIANRKILPKQNNRLIKQYRLVETIEQNLSLYYICFNKIGLLQPRQFTYLKYTVISSTNPYGHWQVCISKKANAGRNNSPGKQGKVFSVSYILEESGENTQSEKQKQIKLKVRTYINLQINSNIQKVWDQILTQLKQYVDDMWEEVQSDYSEELV